jgi:hybrid cluster-associated redox disulfide protein
MVIKRACFWQYQKQRNGGKFMAQVTGQTLIGELLKINTGVIPILMEAGMHCVGCPSSQGESIEEACMVHGIDSDGLVKQLNEFLSDK